jgi:TrmH family RNA methyltransferase
MIGLVRDGSLIPRFGRARRDPQAVVLEGLHAVKHALRFGAELELLLTPDAAALDQLARRLAADVAGQIGELACEVDPKLFAALAPLPPSTGAIALARRPVVDVAALLARPGRAASAAGDRGQPSSADPDADTDAEADAEAGASAVAPLILLENPRDLGNLGACVRVAAGAEAGGVLTTGTHDPWQADAVRGAAGLHFALPVARLEGGLAALEALERPLLALDPEGDPLVPSALDPACALAFGTERDGLSPELLALAEARVSIPMRPGVSSLNLATSVAAVLFAWRLAGG